MRRNNILIMVVVISLFASIEAVAHELDLGKTYRLVMPEWDLRSTDYVADILLMEVVLSEVDEDTFLMMPVEEYYRVMQSWDKPREKGFVGEIGTGGSIRITGILGKGEAAISLDLAGSLVRDNVIHGNATARMGHVTDKNPPWIFKSEWALEPVDIGEPYEISGSVTYHGPKIIPKKATTSTPEERAKRPVSDDSGIKYIAREEPKERERIYRGIASERKPYYDKLLEELTWDEISYTPGILLLIDHLASLEEVDRGRIAKAYVRDGSVQFFDGISYEELQKTPPLFAILQVAGRMDQGEVEALRRESDLFDGMYRAYEQIPEDERAELSLHELMVEVSKNLPVNIRKQYFERSEKLQEYVASSRGDDLRPLYR